MKYIPAEKLIAEIEKRQEELSDHNFHSMAEEYDNVLDIIKSLQQEQMEIEKEAEINPSMISNFGSCVFNLSITFTQDEMNKMNIAPFFTKKVNVIIKDSE